MAGQQPQQLRQDELPDYSYVGPFGGIQTEVPLDKIGRTGFAEVQNMLFRKACAQLISAYQSLPRPASGGTIAQLVGMINGLAGMISGLSTPVFDGPIVGIADFFNVNGARIFVIWTPKSMYQWNGVSWLQVNGTLSGSMTQFMMWDVVGYKLYFSQQQDKVQVWDGLTNSFAAANGAAVPGKYLCELDFHLLVANTLESGQSAPNRIHWTGIGDGTDWTSFSSGQTDLFNGLGPINGLGRVYQSGYAFQQWGITQIEPTGIGLAPFQFIPMGSRAKGSILPYGVATFGEVIATYVGKDDVYIFDGTQSQGIGSKPIDGNRRLGARSRIFTDLYTASLTNIFGFINTSNNGVDYESYWLLIPALNKAWVYHFDESNWTQVYFNPNQLYGPVGIFNGLQGNIPEIQQLIGTIAAQSWTFASLTNSAPLDTMAFSDGIANSVSLLQPGIPGTLPTSGSINQTDGWYIRSGALTFDDPRHTHTFKKMRLSFIDQGTVTVYIRVSNDKGQTSTKTVTFGNGSGKPITQVVSFEIPGTFITWELSGPPGVNCVLTEIAPVYDVGGEVQNR
jgi:hypothetical protein